MYAVPLTILSWTNYVLIHTILKRRIWRHKIAPHSQSTRMGDGDHLSNIRKKRTEHKAILTLVLVTLSFMVLQIPDISLNFIWRFSPQYGPTASIFSYQLMILNSSINFIIYAISSNVFKKRLVKVFKCADWSSTESNQETMLGRQVTIGSK